MAELLLPEIGNVCTPAEEMGEETYNVLVKYFTDNRFIVFNKEIDDTAIETVVMRIIKWNHEDKSIPTEQRKPIVIFLNSVGGELFNSLLLVDVIKTSKTPVKTIGMGLVASGAYYIYINGIERIAFSNTVFLQHDGSIETAGTNSKVKDFIAFNDRAVAKVKQMVLGATNITEEFYDKIFEKEYYFFADAGKELGVVDKIIGVDVDMDYIFG